MPLMTSGWRRWVVVAAMASLVCSLLVVGGGPVMAQDGATPPAAEVPADGPVAFAWESTGGTDRPFADPFQLAVAPNGTLWVADGLNSRFQIFTPDGEFLEAWGTPGAAEGQFDFTDPSWDPSGAVAFDGEGNIYVVDPGNRRVQKFTPDRAFVTAWGAEGTEDGQFGHPYDIAIDAGSRVYVIDDRRDDVQVFDTDGRFLYKFAAPGLDPGQLSATGGLAIAPDGTVWIADYGNGRLQAFAADGTFLRAVGEFGSREGQFITPYDLAVDTHGRVYVADTGNYRIQVFAGDGEFLTQFGGLGVGGGQFMGPVGIALDRAGTIYVSDTGLDRVTAHQLAPPLAMSAATPVP